MGSSSLPRMRSSVGRDVRLRGGGRAFVAVPEEGVGEGDDLDVRRIRILADLRIDEEGDRQLRTLARLQRMLVEAEALDLVEVLPGIEGRDVEGGGADGRLVRQVLHPIDGGDAF